MGKNFYAPIEVTERQILASKEAEFNCLGLMLRDRETIHVIFGIIAPNDFNYHPHILIAEAIKELYDSNLHIDYITVGDYLGKQNNLQAAGGIVQLTNLSDLAVSSDKAEEYANIIRDWSSLRRVDNLCKSKLSEIQNGVVTSPINIIDEFTRELHTVGSRLTKGDFVAASELNDGIYSKIKQAKLFGNVQIGTPSGLSSLDQMTGGFHRGSYNILGARPSMGKTAIGLQFGAHCALEEGKPVAFFSLEMGKEQLMYRLISGDSGVSMIEMMKGNISNHELEKIEASIAKLNNAPIYIDDTPESTVLEIKTKIKKLQNLTGELGLVIIDYISYIRSSKNHETDHASIAAISIELKTMARELNIPLLVLAQVGRGVEGRQDKVPMLSDLAGSDQISRDADLVLMLYRPEYYNKKQGYNFQQGGKTSEANANLNKGFSDPSQTSNEAMILIEKHRNGPTGPVPVQFNPVTMKFISGYNQIKN